MTAAILVRAIHFGATIVAFGAFAFSALVGSRGSLANERDLFGELHARLMRMAGTGLLIALLSSLLWLGVVAKNMSGLPLEQAIAPHVLATVLGQTQFGRVWLLRLILIALLLAAVPLLIRTRVPGGFPCAPAFVGILLGGVVLVTIAGTGHAAAATGPSGWLLLTADALHLLAAGAWLGALVPLVWLLSRGRGTGSREWLDLAAIATRRFSMLGVIVMPTIIVTGMTNAWILVGSLQALETTPYGRLLIAKLIALTVILILAAVNRNILGPRLLAASRAGTKDPSLRSLWCNASIEIGLGFAILVIVGALGIMVPAIEAASAAHESMMLH
jgi:putative copper resistance protein D